MQFEVAVGPRRPVGAGRVLLARGQRENAVGSAAPGQTLAFAVVHGKGTHLPAAPGPGLDEAAAALSEGDAGIPASDARAPPRVESVFEFGLRPAVAGMLPIAPRSPRERARRSAWMASSPAAPSCPMAATGCCGSLLTEAAVDAALDRAHAAAAQTTWINCASARNQTIDEETGGWLECPPKTAPREGNKRGFDAHASGGNEGA